VNVGLNESASGRHGSARQGERVCMVRRRHCIWGKYLVRIRDMLGGIERVVMFSCLRDGGVSEGEALVGCESCCGTASGPNTLQMLGHDSSKL